MAEGGDNESIQRTARRRIGIGVTVDLLHVFVVAQLPLSALFGIVQNSRGLADTFAKALAACGLSSRGLTLVRMDNFVCVCATIARAVVHSFAFDHGSADGVDGVDEIDTCHSLYGVLREFLG